jgi:lipopolysaccharide biosynthesis glycosyltransferase
MSLRSLAQRIGSAPEAATAPSSTAMFFVLNRSFLRGLKTLVYSLIAHRTLLDLPIVIISEDASLGDDPLVIEIADRLVLASDADIAQFRNISGEVVAPALKLDWIPKYTYLKWLIFDDYGFDQHVFLDADIVCLRPIDELTDFRNADIYGGPVFDRRLIRGVDRKLHPLAVRMEYVLPFVRQARPPGSRLNTGVLVLNRKTLTSEFREKLIRTAEAGQYTVEQAAVRHYVRNHSDATLELFSPLYNFNFNFMVDLPIATQVELLRDIKLLHFPSSKGKPWERPRSRKFSEQVWWAYAHEASRADPIFRTEAPPRE